MDLLLIIFGLVLLIKCADLFVDGCSNIARSLGIPSLIIGLTIVSIGTSAPEAAVSVTASLEGMNAMSLGNVVGSNFCNLLLVLGVSGLFGTLIAKKEVIKRDYIYAIVSVFIVLLFSLEYFLQGKTEGIVTRTNGLVLLSILVIYLYTLVKDAKRKRNKDEDKEKFKLISILYIILGCIGIIIGGEIVVDSATNLAETLGVSQTLIALTMVAVGTSLPELVTSVVAVKKGETDLAIGNVVGSNIFNILFVLGLSSSISPITYGLESFYDILILFVVSILVYILILKNKKISMKEGILLLIIYSSYMVYIVVR